MSEEGEVRQGRKAVFPLRQGETQQSSPLLRRLGKRVWKGGVGANREKAEEVARTVLRVWVERAENLPALDSNGTSDPFCKVHYGAKTKTTSTIPKNLNPVWDEHFDFPYREGEALRLECHDRDFVGTDFIGIVRISCAEASHVVQWRWYKFQDGKGNYMPYSRIRVGIQTLNEQEAGLSSSAGKEVSLMTAVVRHLKPIIENIFKLLYVLLRPIFLYLTQVRRVLIDWESPSQAIVISVVFYYLWWTDNLLFGACFLAWWALTKRLLRFQLFGEEYVELDPKLKLKDMQAEFKDAKTELVYGKETSISEDLQKVAKVTGSLADAVLEIQRLWNWSGPVAPTAAAWVVIMVFPFAYRFIPWGFLFYYLFRYGLLALWVVVTIALPIKFKFPLLILRLRRYWKYRTASRFNHVTTTRDGDLQGALLQSSYVHEMVRLGISKKWRKGIVVDNPEALQTMFFYVHTARMTRGRITHTHEFVQPTVLLLERYRELNPHFNYQEFVTRHLQPLHITKGGKVTLFDARATAAALRAYPVLALHFYWWFACAFSCSRSTVVRMRSNTAGPMTAADVDGDGEELEGERSDANVAINEFYRCFQLDPATERVVHWLPEAYKTKRGKKLFGALFLTTNYLAFLPATEEDRWLLPFCDVTTVYMKTGALIIESMDGSHKVRHPSMHDLNTMRTQINHAQRFHQQSSLSVGHIDRANVKASAVEIGDVSVVLGGASGLQKRVHEGSPLLVRRSGSTSSLLASRRSSRRLSAHVGVALTAEPVATNSTTAYQKALSSVAGEKKKKTATTLSNANNADTTNAAVVSEGSGGAGTATKQENRNGVGSEGTVPDGDDSNDNGTANAAADSAWSKESAVPWRCVRVGDLLTAAEVDSLLDPIFKRSYKAGTVIYEGGVDRPCSLFVVRSGTVRLKKRERTVVDVEDGSVFGLLEFLLQTTPQMSATAQTDVVCYELPKGVLLGLLDEEPALGAHFLEFLCYVVFERSITRSTGVGTIL